MVFFTERFFQSNVITSDATAMDTGTSVSQPVGVDTSDDIAPDKPAPDLRSPWSTSDADDASTATVLRWTPAPLPHWRPVIHRTVWIQSSKIKTVQFFYRTGKCGPSVNIKGIDLGKVVVELVLQFAVLTVRVDAVTLDRRSIFGSLISDNAIYVVKWKRAVNTASIYLRRYNTPTIITV